MKKHIVLGVTGGIACYKALDIASKLTQDGHFVEVVMTKAARQLVQPLSFHAVTQNPVVLDMFDTVEKYSTKHIELTNKADLFVVVPATANFIAKVAHGIADDMLTTAMLSVRCPVVIAPAMNTYMYNNKIVQENIQKLKNVGYNVLDVDSGHLACGDTGKGRLLEVEKILSILREYLK